MQYIWGICWFGLVVVDLVYVVCGCFDGFFEYSLQFYDVVGGVLIVQEVGGIVIDF